MKVNYCNLKIKILDSSACTSISLRLLHAVKNTPSSNTGSQNNTVLTCRGPCPPQSRVSSGVRQHCSGLSQRSPKNHQGRRLHSPPEQSASMLHCPHGEKHHLTPYPPRPSQDVPSHWEHSSTQHK